MIIFAHRGASGHAPENTLLSIQTALDMGACWVEVDVFAVEGELVVIHDRRLERRTNGIGDVTRQRLSYLRSLDAGQGERIPLLAEVMELLAGRAGLNIELKGADTPGPVTELVVKYFKKKKFSVDQILISSFNHETLLEVKSLVPPIAVGAIIGGLPLHGAKFAEELNAYSIHMNSIYISHGFVVDAHRRGFKVFAYTVNHIDEFRRMASLGVDGVFTNYPEIAAGGSDIEPK
ncbi:MAG: glycerophosphodiester phosphodiesterase [Deltaproteobacteria bacterium]|nr:glycerophosphodiester phosphodiesterase [Deltaproteobacteria bacterium]